MFYVKLGDTDLRVSQIGVGTWQWGTSWWGWGRGYGERDVVEALHRAVELGVNFVDTAEIYGDGLSEELVGRAIKEAGGEVFVASKVWVTNLTYKDVIKACERSLKRLGVKQIDLYQVHWPNPIIPIKQTMRALEKLVEEGKVRYIGVCNFSLRRLIKAQHALKKERIVSNQVKYNLIEREPEKDLLAYAEREKISIIAYSPLAQGLLSGKYGVKNAPKGDIRRVNILFDKNNIARLQPLLSTLKEISSSIGKTVAQVSLNWLIKNPRVIAIPGVKNKVQAEENAGAASFRLSQEDIERIEEAYQLVRLDKFWSRIRLLVRVLE